VFDSINQLGKRIIIIMQQPPLGLDKIYMQHCVACPRTADTGWPALLGVGRMCMPLGFGGSVRLAAVGVPQLPCGEQAQRASPKSARNLAASASCQLSMGARRP